MKKTVLLGPGGHAEVVLDILKKNENIRVVGFTDKSYPAKKSYKSYPVLGTDEILAELYQKQEVEYAFITVGSTGDNTLRKKLYRKITQIGFKSLNISHPESIISDSVQFGQGNLTAAGCIINPGVIIGNNNIINTGTIIEHGCKISNHTHLAPGSVLGGNVKVGDLSHIGLGAKIIEGITVGRNCLIGAGAVIINDIPDNSVVVGVPGKIIRKRGESNG